ncbi:MAG: MBL fold metallo-hydrolase [Deltaproteobacteria bacterium]|nr:MBL fold metallo-hydrolase [Deltaproteobacteria bacterium]
MKFGNYECYSVEMGRFSLDGGPMFGVVPKALWEKKIASDNKNLIQLTTRSLLIKGEGRIILVDTGLGNKFSKKLKKIYKIDESSTDIDLALAKYELTCSDITDVIITHLHFDHTGGSTSIKDGNIVPTFANATYYLQKEHWEFAIKPNARDAASYIKENFMPLEEYGVLKLIDEQKELFKGIDIIVTQGHTHGQQHLLVKGKTNSLFFCADLIPTSAHLPYLWHMAYDNYPVTIVGEKKKFLNRALKEKWILFFEHDPDIGAASIRQGKKNIVINKKINI